MFYIVSITICCLLALFGTLSVAKNPKDNNYGKFSRRVKNLSLNYVVTAMVMLIGLIAYLFGK